MCIENKSSNKSSKQKTKTNKWKKITYRKQKPTKINVVIEKNYLFKNSILHTYKYRLQSIKI